MVLETQRSCSSAGRSHTQQCFYCVHKVANISVIREDTHTLTHTQTCFFSRSLSGAAWSAVLLGWLLPWLHE